MLKAFWNKSLGQPAIISTSISKAMPLGRSKPRRSARAWSAAMTSPGWLGARSLSAPSIAPGRPASMSSIRSGRKMLASSCQDSAKAIIRRHAVSLGKVGIAVFPPEWGRMVAADVAVVMVCDLLGQNPAVKDGGGVGERLAGVMQREFRADQCHLRWRQVRPAPLGEGHVGGAGHPPGIDDHRSIPDYSRIA